MSGNNVEVVVDAKFLKCDIQGGFLKTDTDKRLVLLGCPGDPKDVSISEIVEAFSGGESMKDGINNSIDDKSALDAIKFRLNTVYYKKTWVKKGKGFESDANDYAFSIDVSTDGILEKFGIPGEIIDVKGVKLKIWNIEDEEILESLKFGEVTKLLQG